MREATVAGAGSPDAETAEEPSGRRKAPARWLARVLGLISLAIALALFQFTQTATGRNAAAALLRDALAARINGEVHIGPVIGGNLVTRLTVSRFEIRDLDAELFVRLDTVTIEYDPLALLGRELRIRRLHVKDMDVRLIQAQDGHWNYERLFEGDIEPGADTTRGAAADSAAAPVEASDVSTGDSIGLERADPFRMVFRDASVEAGAIQIRTPWTAHLDGTARERALREARSGESLWALHETPDGEFERLYKLEDIRGRFRRCGLSIPLGPSVSDSRR